MGELGPSSLELGGTLADLADWKANRVAQGAGPEAIYLASLRQGVCRSLSHATRFVSDSGPHARFRATSGSPCSPFTTVATRF